MIKDILSENKLKLLYNKYEDDYIDNLDENNFIRVYNTFKKYKFYFIDDIIVNYLEIFELDCDYVEKKILELKEKIGGNFVIKIGNDMRYLEYLLDMEEQI